LKYNNYNNNNNEFILLGLVLPFKLILVRHGGSPKYNTNPHMRINWNGEPSGYAENPDNWIFLRK